MLPNPHTTPPPSSSFLVFLPCFTTMATHYRKLMNESIEDSITDLCAPYCEPEKNQLGLCPLTCISFCYPICQRPFLAAILLPPSATTTTPPAAALDDDHADIHYKSSQILAISLAIIVIAFIFLVFYTICELCAAGCYSRREASEEEGGNDEYLDQDLENDHQVYHPVWYITRVGLQQSVISSITMFKYKKGDSLVEGTECAVCLNEFQEDETLKLLPKCNHAFHVPCIDTWLTSHTNCPMCRADIVLDPVSLSLSPEQNVENPGALEEPHESVSEHEACESSVVHETEEKSPIQSELGNQDSKEESENGVSGKVEGIESSVVTNKVTAKSLATMEPNCSSEQLEQMKGSVSCSGKRVFSRHCRSRKSHLPG